MATKPKLPKKTEKKETLENLTLYTPKTFTRQHGARVRKDSDIRYIVIHYAGVPGLTAHELCDRFIRTTQTKSTHYTIDENEIWRVCEDKYIAWHCGSKTYKHPHARNENSLGVDLCEKITDTSHKNDVNWPGWFFPTATIARAAEFVAALCRRYKLSARASVIRHYDVTGKICPAPFCGPNIISSYTRRPREDDWADFLSKIEKLLS